jgi:hypothetical protein
MGAVVVGHGGVIPQVFGETGGKEKTNCMEMQAAARNCTELQEKW